MDSSAGGDGPEFIAKLCDIAGLYGDPPAHAIVPRSIGSAKLRRWIALTQGCSSNGYDDDPSSLHTTKATIGLSGRLSAWLAFAETGPLSRNETKIDRRGDGRIRVRLER